MFARALSARHRALINGDTSFAFELPLGEGLVFESLRSVAPGIARAIPADLRVPILRLDPRDSSSQARASSTTSRACRGRC